MDFRPSSDIRGTYFGLSTQADDEQSCHLEILAWVRGLRNPGWRQEDTWVSGFQVLGFRGYVDVGTQAVDKKIYRFQAIWGHGLRYLG